MSVRGGWSTLNALNDFDFSSGCRIPLTLKGGVFDIFFAWSREALLLYSLSILSNSSFCPA